MRNEFAADLETPVSAFLKLAPLQPLFLLESVEKNETMGRYSFIGILPSEYLVLEESSRLASGKRKWTSLFRNDRISFVSH
jgi:anthranilate synthase component 1